MPLRGSVLGQEVNGQRITGVWIGEEVHCECHNEQCSCTGNCGSLACYLWGGVDEGDWLYLCHRCALYFVKQQQVTTPDKEKAVC